MNIAEYYQKLMIWQLKIYCIIVLMKRTGSPWHLDLEHNLLMRIMEEHSKEHHKLQWS